MVTIEICMGSSCFLRGSGEIVEILKKLLASRGLEHRVVLKGSFCMERCTNGVTLKIGDKVFTQVHKEDVEGLFQGEVLPALELGS
ncbi:MAG: (2Fe-2S) ferredoxin domain-containing protein [Firmicutes bacterium]|nr:(2Fe-2S) ferredoxin domain-containing protein [Bacillota bacterium]